MYDKYKEAKRALSHPDGEEYPGALDWAREEIRNHGEDPDDIKTQYWGPSCSDDSDDYDFINKMMPKDDLDWYLKEGYKIDFERDYFNE